MSRVRLIGNKRANYRRDLLDALSRGPRTTGDLARAHGLTCKQVRTLLREDGGVTESLAGQGNRTSTLWSLATGGK